MRPSRRLERIPPYLFAELERKIAAKRAAGDRRDQPRDRRSRTRRRTRRSSPRRSGRSPTRARTSTRPTAAAPSSARRWRRSTRAGSASTLDPETEVMPAIGAKECIFNLNLAFLDPGDVALASDPGYPVYTGGPLLAGAEAVLMPLLPELGFAPDLDAIACRHARAGAADVPQLPEQPDRRGRARRPVRAGRRARRGPRDPGRARQRLQRDHLRRLRGAVVPARRPAPRTSASRCSRCPRATT